MTRLRYGLIGLICVLLGVAQLLLLKALPNASGLLETIPMETEESPTPDFHLGSVVWDVRGYAGDASLEPFRAYFQTHCAGKTGREAAQWLADALRAAIPLGEPRRQFLYSPTYDPATELAAHLNGEPGYCVTLSGFLAATLLAEGIPARVVQFVPEANLRLGQSKEVGGHTVIEVWDKTGGWSIVDPTYDGCPYIGDHPCSAFAALESPDKVRWVPTRTMQTSSGAATFYETTAFALRHGRLRYPEPWLYMRTGPRASYFPFRGKFVIVGPPSWKYGPAQNVLRYGILVCAVIAMCSLSVWLVCQPSARSRLEQPVVSKPARSCCGQRVD